MQLERLTLLNFKNIADAELELCSGINALVGNNGAGKTNILESIYYLSMCKSLTPLSDGQNIRHGESFFLVEGRYRSDMGREELISCSFSRERGSAKCIKRNGKEYERLADHLGLLPLVVISPQDSALINDAAEERRRFLNAFISQIDRGYLNAIMRYNALLQQRNKCLKIGAAESMLEIYDEQIAPLAESIAARRGAIIEQMIPLTMRYYALLSDDKEQVSIEYRSELMGSDMLSLLKKARERDIINQHTTVGIHRDDMVLKIGSYPLRKYGSQGQQKSLLVALKLAQYQIISAERKERAMLLLDDIFDKLDRSRLERLVELVAGEEFGQIFISECNEERMDQVLTRAGAKYELMRVKGGEISRR